MFGLALVFISSIFGEIGASVGKHEFEVRKESMYSLGFFSLLWGTVFFFAYALARPGSFVFDPASLPTFSLRAVFEIVVAYLSVHATVLADRSTFGFLRILTLPFLLLVDLSLGYVLTTGQLIGMTIIAASLILLFMNHGIRRRGAWYTIGVALVAVITISLYKYDITHYNSVAAEQGIISIIIMAYYYGMARMTARENPLRLLRNPVMFVQALVSGVSQVFMSFAYLFAAASVIATANRSFNAFSALISGDVYFKEKHFILKLVVFILMASGIVLLAS